MKEYCFECVFFNRHILRAFSGFYIETGEIISKEEVEKCFVCIKEEKPFRFIHESEIFI
ncbi:MAG: hypothetical protein NUV74_01565 [Candidatus Brocadiaceae bacterium]|nr:hypothetical protein [Candidatus Brocadiaceae bacterium]